MQPPTLKLSRYCRLLSPRGAEGDPHVLYSGITGRIFAVDDRIAQVLSRQERRETAFLTVMSFLHPFDPDSSRRTFSPPRISRSASILAGWEMALRNYARRR